MALKVKQQIWSDLRLFQFWYLKLLLLNSILQHLNCTDWEFYRFTLLFATSLLIFIVQKIGYIYQIARKYFQIKFYRRLLNYSSKLEVEKLGIFLSLLFHMYANILYIKLPILLLSSLFILVLKSSQMNWESDYSGLTDNK